MLFAALAAASLALVVMLTVPTGWKRLSAVSRLRWGRRRDSLITSCGMHCREQLGCAAREPVRRSLFVPRDTSVDRFHEPRAFGAARARGLQTQHSG